MDVFINNFVNIWDADARNYLLAVEQADGQSLEYSVWSAVNAFVVGCKKDGIWDDIKSSCLLAGARTLSGCLVPLKGVPPTNNNFLEADYDRKGGLKGDAGSKSLNTHQLSTLALWMNNHMCVYLSEAPFVPGIIVGVYSLPQAFDFVRRPGDYLFRGRFGSQVIAGVQNATGLVGSATFPGGATLRIDGESYSYTAPFSYLMSEEVPLHVFARYSTDISGVNGWSDGRLSFYSIGDSINLESLDARLSILMARLNDSIP